MFNLFVPLQSYCLTLLISTLMKKISFLLALAAVFIVSCNNNPEPTTAQTKQVTFTVDAFHVSTASLAPRRAPILDDADGTALTDLYVFDGTTQLAHQTSDDDAFGTLTLTMTYGSHNLSFIATRSTGMSYADGILAVTSLRPTFGELQAVTISDVSDAFDITLDRVTGQLVVTIEDAIPADADHLTFSIDNRYTSLDVQTFNGVNGAPVEQSVNIASAVGEAGKTYTFNMLAAVYQEQYTTDVTLAAYRSDNSLIAQHVIHDVPVVSNTKTLLSGKMFSGAQFTITANHSWNESLQPVW